MTVRFKFRLQKVLDYREHIEKQKIEELSAAIKRAREREELLGRLKQEKEYAVNYINKLTSTGITAGHLVQYSRYVESLNGSINTQAQSLSSAEKEVDECRRGLEKAIMERKIMDKLKEIQYGRFTYHLNREQQKEVEDLVNHNIIKA